MSLKDIEHVLAHLGPAVRPLLGTLLIFAVVGPMIGGLLMMPGLLLGMQGLDAIALVPKTFVTFLTAFTVTVPMSYVLGAGPGLLAGLATWAIDRAAPLAGWRIGHAAVVGGLVTMATMAAMGIDLELLTDPYPLTSSIQVYRHPDALRAMVVIGAIAATLCALIARRLGLLCATSAPGLRLTVASCLAKA